MYNNDEFSDYAKKYMDMVFRIAFSYLKSQADADDVTQDALIRLYKTSKAFSSDAHVKNWLIRVTVNLCKNVFRSPWYRNEPIEAYANTLQFEAQEDHELFSVVMGLDKKYSVVVLLYYQEGYSIREISSILHIPEKTVSTRLTRAKAQLKTMLTEV